MFHQEPAHVNKMFFILQNTKISGWDFVTFCEKEKELQLRHNLIFVVGVVSTRSVTPTT
jgi:hypothetical protein